MNFPKIAEQTIAKLGGKENITTLAHCATRLRLTLADESKVDKEAIENIEGVKGQFSTSGQYQIIFGSGTVNKVHAEMQNRWALVICQPLKWLQQARQANHYYNVW